MGLNDGFLETFIFNIETATFKVVLNYTKEICTVYGNNGRILVRMNKLHSWQLNKIKKEIDDYMKSRSNQLPNFNKYQYKGFRIT